MAVIALLFLCACGHRTSCQPAGAGNRWIAGAIAAPLVLVLRVDCYRRSKSSEYLRSAHAGLREIIVDVVRQHIQDKQEDLVSGQFSFDIASHSERRSSQVG
jgi:hypothetical protein